MKDAVWIASRLRQIIEDMGLKPPEMWAEMMDEYWLPQLEEVKQAAIDLAGNTIMISDTEEEE